MKKLLNTLYITNKDAYACKEDDNVCVRLNGERVLKVPLHLLEGIVLFNYAGASSALLGACAKNGISVAIFDEKGKFAARVEGPISGNVLLRKGQYRISDDEEQSLAIAKRFLTAKLINSKRVVLRHARDHPSFKTDKTMRAVELFDAGVESVVAMRSLGDLLGVEGDAARTYFDRFRLMLKPEDLKKLFTGRNKHPSKDPVNATLSFFYVMLTRELAAACECVGLDPQVGFFYQPRPGRASLACDLVEEFRAPFVDRFVLSLFNRGQLSLDDFEYDAEGACFFTNSGIKKALDAWQKRKQDEIVHPFLKEKVKLGLLPFVQAQLLARYIRGDLDDYPAFLWR